MKYLHLVVSVCIASTTLASPMPTDLGSVREERDSGLERRAPHPPSNTGIRRPPPQWVYQQGPELSSSSEESLPDQVSFDASAPESGPHRGGGGGGGGNQRSSTSGGGGSSSSSSTTTTTATQQRAPRQARTHQHTQSGSSSSAAGRGAVSTSRQYASSSSSSGHAYNNNGYGRGRGY